MVEPVSLSSVLYFPTLNAGEHLDKCLASIKSQDIPGRRSKS